MVEFLSGRPAQDLMTEAVQLEDLAMRMGPGGQTTVFTASRTSTDQLSGLVWRRIVIVAAIVSALVGGVVAAAGRTMASEPGVSASSVQAPPVDPSCRALVAIPKRGWVCADHRP